MQNNKKRISIWLSDNRNRAVVHALVLIVSAVFILALGVNFSSDQMPTAPDKANHFRAGQIIASAVFFFSYLAIIFRVLLVRKTKGSLTMKLLWIPTLVGVSLILTIIIVFFIAAGKEFFDMSGAGLVEFTDLTATIDGAVTIIPVIAIIMALTPIFIPFDLIMQLPKMMFKDMQTGIDSIDEYVKETKKVRQMGEKSQVLLVEDDIICATTVLNFCARLQLSCHHVSTLVEAESFFKKNYKTLRLVILDNFVRVESGDKFNTGYSFLKAVSKVFPPGKRHFSVVMISGHAELIKDPSHLADLILQKPWKPSDLLNFLKGNGVV